MSEQESRGPKYHRLNTRCISGYVQGEVTFRYTNSGTAIAEFNLWQPNRNKKQNGDMSFYSVRCKAFGKSAEIINEGAYKGRGIMIQGEGGQESYTSNKTGQEVTVEVVYVSMSWWITDSPKADPNNTGGNGERRNYQRQDPPASAQRVQQEDSQPDDDDPNDDDIPF